MRFHMIIVVLVLLLGLFCSFSAIEMAVLSVVCSSVIVAEMMNTAIETVVDMITQSYHPLAKLSKDIAAGAVLVTAITAASVGLILFISKFWSLKDAQPIVLKEDHTLLPTALIILVVLVVVITLIAKVLGGKGTMLQGGIISGHAAVAFVLAVSIIKRVGWDAMTILLVMVLALMVAQSRVEGKIHTLQEVIIGGLLGICMTAGVYYFRLGIH
jgi:diacylglycerol kinase (ATP)